MAELQPSDLDAYTRGRLPAAEPETQKILDRSLAAARRYCEWPVTPPIANDVVTLDGLGGRVLALPTLKLSALHSVVEEGTSLDVSAIYKSAAGVVRLRKASGACWSRRYSGIVVTMTHGYDETKAEDFRLAVLDACDRFSAEVGTGGLKRYDVDDVEREWFDRPEIAFNTRLLEPFRLIRPH